MKRAILIATGTVGGLGAVLAITPPTFTSADNSALALPDAAAAPEATSSAKASAPQSATPTKAASVATPAATPEATQKSAAKNSAPSNISQSQTPVAAPSTTGTFTGDVVDVRYGYVQVKITVENGKIIDAQAVQAPSGRNDRWTQMSVPVLRQQTLQAQSAAINGVSGASFTSYGWYTSLVSALAKAGL